jgi:hypothetical protein
VSVSCLAVGLVRCHQRGFSNATGGASCGGWIVLLQTRFGDAATTAAATTAAAAAAAAAAASCALGHSFSFIPAALFQVAEKEMTMAALLTGYVVAIAIVFFASWPISINRPRSQWGEKWHKPINWRD